MRSPSDRGLSAPRDSRRPGRRVRLLATAAALALTVVGTTIWHTPATHAATPSSGTVDSTNPSTEWTGGPFLGFSWLVHTDCVVPQATFCDIFILTIGTLPSTTPDVVVSVVGSEYYDEFNIVIVDSNGQVVARSRPDSPHTVTMQNAAPGTYEVRVELVNGSLRLTTYEGRAFAADVGEPVDVEPEECPLFDPVEVVNPLDDGRWVDLDVLVLLDDVDPTYAASVFAGVQTSYEPLKIRVVPTFKVADPPFTTTDATLILDQARDHFPDGEVPAKYDVVEVLTGNDLTSGGSQATMGVADCVGAIAHEGQRLGFAAAEAGHPSEGTPTGPLTLNRDVDANVSAHEIGHLLGGLHQLSNCVEDIEPEEELEDTSPCTVMDGAPQLQGARFSAANGNTVRQLALRYASANDAEKGRCPPPRPTCP